MMENDLADFGIESIAFEVPQEFTLKDYLMDDEHRLGLRLNSKSK